MDKLPKREQVGKEPNHSELFLPVLSFQMSTGKNLKLAEQISATLERFHDQWQRGVIALDLSGSSQWL